MLKVLVIRFSSIGDIILTTPVVRALKTQLPEGSRIHYCSKSAFKILIAHNPYIDKIHLLENDLIKLIQELKKENFDFVIDLHHNLRSFIIKKNLGVKSFSFDKLNFKKWLLVNFRVNILPPIHIVDRYFKTVKLLDVHNDEKGLDFFIPQHDEVNLLTLPFTHQKGYVAFAIGARHFTKRLPPEKIVEFCKIIDLPIILLGGKEDEPTGAFVRNQLLDTEKIFNACGKYNINQSASILRQAVKVFTHDSGLMHIAAAFKKEIVSMWGNTTPHFGMFPYQTSFTVIENNNLNCRPCSKIGYEKCPKGHFKCMRELSLTAT